jgi:hypothetical protein
MRMVITPVQNYIVTKNVPRRNLRKNSDIKGKWRAQKPSDRNSLIIGANLRCRGSKCRSGSRAVASEQSFEKHRKRKTG